MCSLTLEVFVENWAEGRSFVLSMNWFLKGIRGVRRHEGRRILFSNAVSLSVLQIANYILPLITVPYLVRVLGTERFGLVMYAAAFNIYFFILVDFGFDLSATRAIAVCREQLDSVSEIFCSVMILKTCLTILGLGVLLALASSIEHFRSEYGVFLCSFGVTIGQAYFPTWFFQGMEYMKAITILNVLAKLMIAVSLFFFVQSPDDYLAVPIINSLGIIVAAIVSLIVAKVRFKLHFRWPSFSVLKFRVTESAQFFYSRAAVSLYDNSNTFLIGLLLGNVTAGYYAAAEKLFKAMSALQMPLTNSLYPFMAKHRDVRAFRKIFSLTVIGNAIFCLLVFLLAMHIVHVVYGDDFEQAGMLLRLFAILAAVVIPSTLLGYPLLAAMGYSGYANYSVIIGALVHVLMLVVAIPFLSSELVVVLMIVSQLIVLMIRVVGVKKHLSAVFTG